ncbi:hypothetical protein [Bradyrhizobium prioriisuperbiae]|uniref:hypothetical protein n=1 Tax=Bradyrhizobium prioriisuperbiae TaxID=2854389 RepID=UPI0028E31847|nr:hypothetical protein [Bradyrhizobium prioritasuperba]
MTPAIDQTATAQVLAAIDETIPAASRDAIAELLAARNGFFAFESALQVFPALASEPCDLAAWNSPGLWRDTYGSLADGLIFFAQDVFGNQFCVTTEGFGSFNAETGEVEILGSSLEQWCDGILGDYEYLTGHPLCHAWQAQHGQLAADARLTPIRPFVLGGTYSLDNLRVQNGAAYLRQTGRLATMLRDLPDGTQIRWPPPPQ